MNMSYCRFQNTEKDLKDCQAHIDDDVESLSADERRSRKWLIETCMEIAEEFEGATEEDF